MLVDTVPRSDTDNGDKQDIVLHLVDDAQISDSYPVPIARTRHLDNPRWPGIVSERPNAWPKPLLLLPTQAVELPFGGASELDAIGHPARLSVESGFDILPGNGTVSFHLGQRLVGRGIVVPVLQRLHVDRVVDVD